MTDIRNRADSGIANDDLDLLASLLEEEGLAPRTSDAIPRRSAPRGPLSYGQELLWLLDRASPGMTAYNVPLARRVTGTLDLAALERTLAALLERHEILRTTYAGDSEGVQVVTEARVVLETVDLTGRPADVREAEGHALIAEFAARPFDLAHDPMLRARVVQLSDDDHLFVLVSHHIVLDGWSRSIVLREMSALYAAFREGTAPSLPPLAIQYADYAAWQRETLSGERLATLLEYWRRRLAAPLPMLDLPTDRPRPVVPSFRGATRATTIPAATLHALRELARRHDVTLYMVLLAGYQSLLHRYGGGDDIIVGSPIAGRGRPEVEPLVGYFASAVPLRTDLSGDPTFSDLLGRVRETALGAFEHQDVPLEKLVLELQRSEALTPAPLFRVVLTMQDTLPGTLAFAGVELSPLALESATTKFDLTLLVSERPEGLRLNMEYRTDLFEAETIDRLLGHLGVLLAAAAADPGTRVGALPLLTPQERAQLGAWNDTATPLPGTSVPELFARQARRVGSRTAVVCGGATLTYAELDERSRQLAGRLRAQGAGPDGPVAICLERSTEAVIAMLATLRAGAAYVPLVPSLPAGRIEALLGEVRPAVVVSVAAHRGLLPADAALLCLDEPAPLATDLAAGADGSPAGSDLAYILFTSGSTGTPKGVAITHENLVNYVTGVARVLDLDLESDDRVLHFASVTTLAADLGNTAVFPALLSGGCLHLVPEQIATDASAYADYVAARPVDVLKITPSHLRALMAGPGGTRVLPSRTLVLGGEASAWELVDEVERAGRCRVVNHYGPTETTVGCCALPIDAETRRALARSAPATVPIGRPLANARAYVLDHRSQLVPVGVAGELYVGGLGVARGYHGQPGLTAERFLTDPFQSRPGARIYRTGDRVRRLPTGDIEFLGRADDQVKIRGYRVELGEVEAAIGRCAGVTQVAVVRWAPAEGDAQLVAYVVGTATADAVRAAASATLPEYMVPSVTVPLDRLPLNANGKVDRRALPAPDVSGTGMATFVAPRTPLETQLATIWADALRKERVGVTDSFFDLGGHSLLAIRILGRLSKELGVRLPLRALFEAPTVEQLAVLVAAQQAAGPIGPARITRLARGSAPNPAPPTSEPAGA